MISLEKIESFSSFAKMLNRNSNFVNSASIVYSLEGQLVEIAKEETEARAYTLTIKSGEKEFDYFVSEKEAEKISVIFVNENRRSGTITNLSEGDLVTINTTVDLLAKESESKVIIAID